MLQYTLPTQITLFASLDAFVTKSGFTQKDLIVTNKPIYTPRLQAYKLPCRVVFQEEYGLGEPNDAMMNAILASLEGCDYKRVFAIGGGTVLDVAKVLALEGVRDVRDALYGAIQLRKGRELLAVPTTCGTGSEVTGIAIFEDTKAKVKKGIVGPALYPDQALLVPELLYGLPYRFFALSSVDAFIHAVESYLAPASSPVTELFSVRAMENIISAYRRIAEHGKALQQAETEGVLIASTFAGIAFGNTGVGAVHAMSYPLGGTYHVPHGEANYALLGVVLHNYARRKPDGKIQDVQTLIGKVLGTDKEQAFSALENLLEAIIPLKKLRDYGVRAGELGEFTDSAMRQERLMKNNYVPLSHQDVLDMYTARY